MEHQTTGEKQFGLGKLPMSFANRVRPREPREGSDDAVEDNREPTVDAETVTNASQR